jgi:hypothetical protein
MKELLQHSPSPNPAKNSANHIFEAAGLLKAELRLAVAASMSS